MTKLTQLRTLSLLVVAAGLIAFPNSAAAQFGGPAINVFPPAPRSLRQNLVRAKKAIEEERFSDAVAELGVVLTGATLDQPAGTTEENQDFFVEVPGQTGTQSSIKAEAQRLLGSLPPKGRELFELQFGADARALLDAAVQDADVNQLNEVVRRYFHTNAGYEAALLLGRLHLDHGRPLAAALCLQRVANVPGAAARFEPELSLLLAACWQLARQPAQAQATLANLPGQLPRGQVRLGDADVRELPRTDQADAWLTEHFQSVAGDDAELGQWPLFRGNAARNALGTGGLPLRRSRWQVPLVKDEHDRGLIEEIRGSFVEQGSPMLPVVQPLAVANVIVMRTAESLVGINFQTGKRVWKYPPWEPDDEPPSSPAVPPQNDRENRKNALRERFWQDTPFGQVSSDGNAVYLLDSLRQTLPQPSRNMRFRRGMFNIDPSIFQNELVALGLQKEGYLLWKAGGDDGGSEPRLAGAFFLGPPLPLFGHLYLIAEIKQELRLVVLDAATGQQQWSQQLAHLEALAGMDEQVRRYSGATPSFADGVLICPTSAGAIVAVDVATRALLWGFQYPTTRDAMTRPNFMQQFPTPPVFPTQRWQDASVTIADGAVVLTPPEADTLVCLDLLTGKTRWEPLLRNGELADMLYVAGVHDGNIVLVAKDRVQAIRLKDGKPAWKESVKFNKDEGEMPSGRGFLSDHFYFLPTTEANLVKIDLNRGAIAERSKADHVLGNLICFHDEIVSVASDRAATFYQIDPLRKLVVARLNKSPDDPWALARHGELLVHDGKITEALGVLQKARDRNRQDEGVRSLLVDTFLVALEDDFNKHSAVAASVAELIDNDAQRTKYLMLMAAGHHKAGNLVAAAEHYGQLVRLYALSAKKTPSGEAFASIAVDPNTTVRADRFLAARLAELYNAGDSQVQERLDHLIVELGTQLNTGSVVELRNYLWLCGFHPAADAQRIKLVEKLIPINELLEAELVLAPLLRRNNAQLGGQALAWSAQIYAAAKKPRMLAAAAQQLITAWGDVPVLQGKTGRQLAAELMTAGLDYPMANLEWPWGMNSFTESREPARQSNGVHPSFPLMERRGAALEGLRVQFDSQRTESCLLRDSNGSAVLRLPQFPLRGPVDSGLWRTAADNHLLFIAMGGQIMSIDTLRPRPNDNDASLWHDTLWNSETESPSRIPRDIRNPLIPYQPPEFRWGDASERPVASVGPMTANGVCFQKIRAVTCVDPLTKTALWSRSDFDQGCELFGDEEWIFIQAPVSAKSMANSVPDGMIECSVVSTFDGRLTGKRRIPVPGNRWAIRGRNILAWEKKGTETRLYLFDAHRQADVWSESFAEGSRGCLIDNDAVAVLEPNGRFVLRSIAGDAEKLETKVEPTTGLAGIHVLRSEDQLLLIVNDIQLKPQDTESGRRIVPTVLLPINGRIFSLDRTTGQALWQVPAVVRGYSMLPNQPDDVPTLWFVRPGSVNTNQFSPSSNARVDVLCLDRRTGSELLRRKEVASQINTFDIVCDVRKGEVQLALPQVQFTVRFTKDPRPPAPPFQQPRDGNSYDAAAIEVFKHVVQFFNFIVPAPKNDPFK